MAGVVVAHRGSSAAAAIRQEYMQTFYNNCCATVRADLLRSLLIYKLWIWYKIYVIINLLSLSSDKKCKLPS